MAKGEETMLKEMDVRSAARQAARRQFLDSAEIYLRCVDDNKGLLGEVMQAYEACMSAGETLSDVFRTEVSNLLEDMHRRNEWAWAKFLSIHVGFSDPDRFDRFKRISPFRGSIVVEQDEHGDVPETVTLRGEVKKYLETLQRGLGVERDTFYITTLRDETGQDLRVITRYVLTLHIPHTDA